MTNLLEKTLLIGFGIFTMTIFFILITPFIVRITDYKENDKNDLDNYNNTINPIINANHNEIEKPNKFYLINVEKISHLDYDGDLKENFQISVPSYVDFFLKNFLKTFHSKSSI